MALDISVTISPKQLKQVSFILKDTPRKIPGLFKKALNDTIRDTRKDVIAQTKKITTAPASRIRKALKVKKAKTREAEASVTIFDKRINLINFRAKALGGRQRTLKSGQVKTTTSGVSYQITKRGGRKQIRERPLRFISTVYGFTAKDPVTGKKTPIKKRDAAATGRAGHRGVFKRVGPSRTKSKLVELMGPSIGALLRDEPAVLKKIESNANDKLSDNINKRLKEVLDKRVS